MPLMEWIAQKHPALVHVPVAVALLIPIPLLAAQRPGRGIRPWWTVCRFLAWSGFLGSLFALLSGFAWARQLGLLAPGVWLAPKGEGLGALFRLHQILALSGLGLGLLTLWAVHRPRKDHQNIGFLALLLGLLWSGAFAGAGWVGGRMTHPASAPAPAPEPPPQAQAPAPDPEAEAPYRYLDYGSLEPVHEEPVKSPEHGGRWIRVWVTASGIEAYKAGNPLPAGAYAVMTSLEDRWGRPSVESGPLEALEASAEGRPIFTSYWPRVPAARQGETGGKARVYGRGQDPEVQKCAACHAQGLSDPSQRSAWKAPRRATQSLRTE